MKNPVVIAKLSELKDKTPTYALVSNTDLVIIKHEKGISVLYGRCHHRGALLADGYIEGHNLICGVHGWDYRYDTGISEYNNDEQLHKFQEVVQGDDLLVDENEVAAFEVKHPQPFHSPPE